MKLQDSKGKYSFTFVLQMFWNLMKLQDSKGTLYMIGDALQFWNLMKLQDSKATCTAIFLFIRFGVLKDYNLITSNEKNIKI